MSLPSPFFQSLLMPQIHEEMGAAYRVLDACKSQVHRSSDTYFQICVRVPLSKEGSCPPTPPENSFFRLQWHVMGTQHFVLVRRYNLRATGGVTRRGMWGFVFFADSVASCPIPHVALRPQNLMVV